MKRNIAVFLSLFVFLALFVFTGCSQYSETGLGEVTVIRQGAAFRSEGGGVLDSEAKPGTEKVGGATVDVKEFHICHTPRTVYIRDLPVIMTNMKNQNLKFTPYLTYSLNPSEASKLFKNFKSYDQEIKTIFRESCLRKLSKLEMGLDLNIYSDETRKSEPVDAGEGELEFDERDRVAKSIFDDFLKKFSGRYGEYMDCFVFIDVAVGNVEFDPDILKKLEEAVAKQYQTESLKIQKEVMDLEGQIRVAESKADLGAYGLEAGALTDEVIEYMGNDMIDKFIENPNIDTTVIIPLNEDGTISWFQKNK